MSDIIVLFLVAESPEVTIMLFDYFRTANIIYKYAYVFKTLYDRDILIEQLIEMDYTLKVHDEILNLINKSFI